MGANSFAAFAAAAMPQLRRMAWTYCRDTHRADDLVQATLERVCSRWSRVSRADDPLAYTRTVMVRLMIDEQRRPWWRRETVTDELPDAALATSDRDADLDLASLVRRLPARQRLVIVLRYLEDLPVRDVARLLGCSEGNVKSQTHVALATLRRWSTTSDPTGAHP